MERAPAGLEKHLHAIGVVDVTTAELDAGLRLELAGVADCAELGRCWQLAILSSQALGLKAWQALFFVHGSSAFVSTCHLLVAEWNSPAREQFLRLFRSCFLLLLLLYCILVK